MDLVAAWGGCENTFTGLGLIFCASRRRASMGYPVKMGVERAFCLLVAKTCHLGIKVGNYEPSLQGDLQARYVDL